MSLLQYTISNTSAASKTFSYSVETVPNTITIAGFSQANLIADDIPAPALIPAGVSEEEFLSTSYIPVSGEALLWSDGNKVKHVKISNTPLTGSSIDPIIDRTQWVEFSMLAAKDKNGNFLYPNSTTTPQIEKFNIEGVQKLTTYNALEINPNTSSPAVSANTSSAETGFSFFDKQFLVPSSCNPLSNNVVESRTNEWLQDVDYSVNAITPLNFNQLIKFEAIRATVPQSNYTKLGFVNSRYVGSSTTREKINEYNPNSNIDSFNKFFYNDGGLTPFLYNVGKGPNIGKIPNVELNNAYIAYFNKVIDPYPLLNNKTAYYAKYLIDDQGNILDPGLSSINYSTFTETFKLKDYDNKPTRVNVSIQNIEEYKELTKLTSGLPSVYAIGEYPIPILYTQTSSIGHVNEIALSGSKFYSTLGIGEEFLNLGANIYATQSFNAAVAPKSPQNLSLNTLKYVSSDITPFISNNDPTTLPTSSLTIGDDKFALLFPLDNSNRLGDEKNKPGGILSDDYKVEGSFTFTTSTIPAKYKGALLNSNYIDNYLDREKVQDSKLLTFNLYTLMKSPIPGDTIENYSNINNGFKVKKVKLTITTNPGDANNEVIYPSLDIPSNNAVDSLNSLNNLDFNFSGFIYPPGSSYDLSNVFTLNNNYVGYGAQWRLTPTGFTLTPDSLFIEELIISNFYNKSVFDRTARREALSLIAGGWYENYGRNGIPVKYDWTIEFEFSPSVIRQDVGLYLKAEGILKPQNGEKPFGIPKDVFLFFGDNGIPRSDWQWARTFTPTYATNIDVQPILNYKITSPLTENASINKALGPFWRRYPDPNNPLAFTVDKLYMSSSILNQAYSSSYIQAKLPYIGATSTDFPLTVEPSFIEFDPVTEFWGLEIGDEIRFENNEDLVYTIVSSPQSPKNAFSENISDKLQVTISPPFEYTGSEGQIISNQPRNFDFFVVRRWKENKNFIILNQQKPYGFPVSQSSVPGILLPEHRVDKFNVNPDLVLKDLIEKNII